MLDAAKVPKKLNALGLSLIFGIIVPLNATRRAI